jgi:hypothetical protein
VFPPRNVHSMSLTMSLDIQEWTSCAEVSAPRSHTSSKRHSKFPRATRDDRAIDPRESPRRPWIGGYGFTARDRGSRPPRRRAP